MFVMKMKFPGKLILFLSKGFHLTKNVKIKINRDLESP